LSYARVAAIIFGPRGLHYIIQFTSTTSVFVQYAVYILKVCSTFINL